MKRYHEKSFARWLRARGITEAEAFRIYDEMWAREACCAGNRMPTLFHVALDTHVGLIRRVRSGT